MILMLLLLLLPAIAAVAAVAGLLRHAMSERTPPGQDLHDIFCIPVYGVSASNRAYTGGVVCFQYI